MNTIDTVLAQLSHIADQKKANHIRIYKPKDTFVADAIMVIGAQNTVHCKSLSEELDKAMSQQAPLTPALFFEHPKISGDAPSGWIIIDALSIVIHVMTDTTRHFYELDAFFEQRGVVYHV